MKKKWFILIFLSIILVASIGLSYSKNQHNNKKNGPNIAIISKGFQHQFWQIVKKGAEDAALDLGAHVTFDGPPTESDINIQVDMLKSAMARNPDALCLAALDTNSIIEQLYEAKHKGIPIIGFDSGVPNAPENLIYATASTDNYNAASIAADFLFKNDVFQSKLKDNHIVIGVLSQDATSDSIIKRTSGFIDSLKLKIESQYGTGTVEVKGHTVFSVKSTDKNKIKATIIVNVPATTTSSDMKSGAELLLSSKDIVAVYASNENAVGGILSATNDGSDFATNRKYGNIIAIGFDAGRTQKTAIEKGWLYGSITQDPYQIGYKTVVLAVDAINNKKQLDSIIDTGAKWYNNINLKDPIISQLIYN